MTLRTVTGPTIPAALADARRLFGDDAVMLQSSPASAAGPASVTVAFDQAPAAPRRASTPAAPARPEAVAAAPPRAYGYGPARKVRPTEQEPASAPAPTAPAPPPPAASAAEVAELRARLASLEALLAQRQAAPARRPALVLVGPAGGGKTSLALRLAGRPDLLDAVAPAVLVVAPESGLFIDPAAAFWGTGVPVAVVRSEAEVQGALATFADADRIVVDTPSLPLDTDRAGPVVERLAALLAPLAPLDVHFVADASRPATLTAEAVGRLGLRPDALALTRLDEAAPDAERAWRGALGWPLRLTAAGTDPADVSRALPLPVSQPPVAQPPVPEPVADVPPASGPPVPRLTLPPPPHRASASDYLGALLADDDPAPEAEAADPFAFAA